MIKVQVLVSIKNRTEYSKFDQLRSLLSRTKKYSFDWQPIMGPVIELNLNNSVVDSDKERPVLPPVDYFLSLHTDMDVKRTHIYDLLEHSIKDNLDILGALYLRNMPENAKGHTIFEASYDGQSFVDKQESGVRPCKVVGSNCLLIKKAVFEKLDNPWFETSWLRQNGEVQHINHDVIFCAKATNAGFAVAVDHDVVVRNNLSYHLGG